VHQQDVRVVRLTPETSLGGVTAPAMYRHYSLEGIVNCLLAFATVPSSQVKSQTVSVANVAGDPGNAIVIAHREGMRMYSQSNTSEQPRCCYIGACLANDWQIRCTRFRPIIQCG
jgi:hypothetical protein